jgi:hypothetical protein
MEGQSRGHRRTEEGVASFWTLRRAFRAWCLGQGLESPAKSHLGQYSIWEAL